MNSKVWWSAYLHHWQPWLNWKILQNAFNFFRVVPVIRKSALKVESLWVCSTSRPMYVYLTFCVHCALSDGSYIAPNESIAMSREYSPLWNGNKETKTEFRGVHRTITLASCSCDCKWSVQSERILRRMHKHCHAWFKVCACALQRNSAHNLLINRSRSSSRQCQSRSHDKRANFNSNKVIIINNLPIPLSSARDRLDHCTKALHTTVRKTHLKIRQNERFVRFRNHVKGDSA